MDSETSGAEVKVPSELDSSNSVNKNGQDLVFTGSGKEFFGIWIINVVLSICTLGIYSAWAKVRTKRYFYGNTVLAGSSFAYVANPIAILKGRLIAGSVFVVYSIVSSMEPELGLLLFLFGMLVLPAIIVRSLKFRFRNTEYRGMRFDFKGTTAQAYATYLLGYVVVGITLGLAYPWWARKQSVYLMGGTAFGQSRFVCVARLGVFYKRAMVVVGGFVFIMSVSFLFIYSATEVLAPEGAAQPSLLVSSVPLLFMFFTFVFLANWIAHTTNHVIDNTTLEKITFKSRLTGIGLFRLWFGNLFLLGWSLGLATPWVMVRNARYRIEHTSVVAGDVDALIASRTQPVSSLSDEMAELFDVDLGI
jgi:uncharacterized membrane protein YjgN (DUF898 family)